MCSSLIAMSCKSSKYTQVTALLYHYICTTVCRTSNARQLEISFAEEVGFQVNGENFIDRNNAVFFGDLTKVNAWFGGIVESSQDE